MEKKENSKSQNREAASQTKPEPDESALAIELDTTVKIVVKTYQEPTRPYFSSPCMLSEMEDNEDILDGYL